MSTTITNQAALAGKQKAETSRRLVSLMYFLFGIIEALLVLRLALKLMGARTDQIFVYFIYTESGMFLAPFKGIAPEVQTNFWGSMGFYDPGIFIALAVYPLLCWGITKFVQLLPGKFR